MRFFSEDDVRRLLGMDEAIQLMRDVFEGLRRGEAQSQPRRRLYLPSGATLHAMAGAWGRYFGTKIYSTHPAHGAHFNFILYEAGTGKPLALFDANHLGQIRTGAASGYAADLLAPVDAKTLAVLGSGFQAVTQLDAIRRARNFEAVRVWSRSRDKRDAFARSHAGVVPAESVEEAVADADVIVTATSAKDPIVSAVAIRPGVLILAMGSNHPNRRELAADLVSGAGYLVVDSLEQARIESGDLLLALDEAGWARVVELKDAARPAAGVTTIFKSNGLGVQDVAAAAHVFEKATLEQ